MLLEIFAWPLTLPAHAGARWMQIHVAAGNGNSCSQCSGLRASLQFSAAGDTRQRVCRRLYQE